MWWRKDKETTKFPYHQINTKEMKSCVESNVVFVSFGTLPNWWLLTIRCSQISQQSKFGGRTF
jgi:hypothetical protein